MRGLRKTRPGGGLGWRREGSGRARAAVAPGHRRSARSIWDNWLMTPPPCNIAAALPRLAAERPGQPAIRCPGRRGPGNGLAAYDVVLDYRALDARSDAIAAGLARHGIGRGVRTVVMVRPSPEFFLLMFALFKAGAVPVLVDPGIDRRALKQCLDEAQAQAFVGIPLAHLARVMLGWARSATTLVTVGRRWGWGGPRWLRSSARARTTVRSWPPLHRTRWPRSCSPAARPACPRAWSIATAISSRRSR